MGRGVIHLQEILVGKFEGGGAVPRVVGRGRWWGSSKGCHDRQIVDTPMGEDVNGNVEVMSMELAKMMVEWLWGGGRLSACVATCFDWIWLMRRINIPSMLNVSNWPFLVRVSNFAGSSYNIAGGIDCVECHGHCGQLLHCFLKSCGIEYKEQVQIFCAAHGVAMISNQASILQAVPWCVWSVSCPFEVLVVLLSSGSIKASRILPFGGTLDYTTPLFQKVFGNIKLNLEKRHDICTEHNRPIGSMNLFQQRRNSNH